jgi:WD40 repeat protein
LVSSDFGGDLRLWSGFEKGKPTSRELTGQDAPIVSMAFTPDEKYLVAGGHDCALRIWDGLEGSTPNSRELEGHEQPVSSVAFSPDGKYLASGSWDSSLRLWSAFEKATPISSELKGHSEGGVFSVSFSPNGKYIASCGGDKTLRLWSALDQATPISRVLEGHTDYVSCVAFSPDGKYLISSGDDKTLRFWDVDKGTTLGVFPVNFCFTSLCWTSKLLFTGQDDGAVTAWKISIISNTFTGGRSEDVMQPILIWRVGNSIPMSAGGSVLGGAKISDANRDLLVQNGAQLDISQLKVKVLFPT